LEKLEVSRNGETDQFSIVLSEGNDTIRCMVTVESGYATDVSSDNLKYDSALLKAKALARALELAIRHQLENRN
jgi:hypothetical protein